MKPLQGIKRFLVSVKPKKEERTEARQLPSRAARPPSPSRRRSIFGLSGLGSSSKSKRREDAETAEKVVQNQSDQRKRKASPLDEQKQQLREELEKLNRDISYFNERSVHRTAELEGLKAQDDKEKWEDELFETRLRELKSALASIDTRSSVSASDVQRQVEELNRDLAAIASLAVETHITNNKPNLDDVKNYLGEGLLIMFQKLGNTEDEKRLVQMIIQVFLVRSCAEYISSWHVGKPALSNLLNHLYDRIRRKGEYFPSRKFVLSWNLFCSS